MSKLNLKDLKKRLTDERSLLIEKLKGNDLSVDDTETPDPVDLAVQNYSKNVILAVSENETRQLMLIDEALQRIELGSYGICVNCGRDIPVARLEAVPYARNCMNCQEKLERGELDEE